MADQWDIPSCINACKEVLFGLNDSLFPINAVFLLPSHFNSNQIFDDLQAEAEVCLHNEFGDVVDSLINISKLQKFTQLPHEAIYIFLNSDTLTTDDEASVLLLVKAWYDRNRASCSTDQLQELKDRVRYSCLSLSFICSMLPLMPDFQVTPQQAIELCQFKSFAESSNGVSMVNLGLRGTCPDEWYNPERDNKVCSDVGITLALVVSETQLLAHVAAVAKMRAGGDPPLKISSEKKYGFGYDWVLSLSSREVYNALSMDVEIYSHTDSQAHAVAMCKIAFYYPVPDDEETDYNGKMTIDSPVTSSSPATMSYMFGNKIIEAVLAGDSSLGPWNPLLVHGELCLQANLQFE